MSFSQYAGTAIVPTLSRLVLAIAFTTVGYNKLSTNAEFSADDAEILRSLGVSVAPVEPVLAAAPGTSPIVSLAAFPQEDPQDPETEEDPPPAGDEADEDTEDGSGYPPLDLSETASDVEAEVPGDPAPTEVAEPIEAPPAAVGMVSARSMHKITLLCEEKQWPRPVVLAWAAALTELVGGSLLFLGLFSRICGLALASTMGVAFYLVSMGKMGVHTANPFEFAMNIGNFNTIFSQLGLFVLGFGVFLTGPGPLSLDRVLFRRRRGDATIEEYDDDDGPVGGSRPV